MLIQANTGKCRFSQQVLNKTHTESLETSSGTSRNDSFEENRDAISRLGICNAKKIKNPFLESTLTNARRMIKGGGDGNQRAKELLHDGAYTDSTGKISALLGDLYFMDGEFEKANIYYQKALSHSPENARLITLAEKAANNAYAEVNDFVVNPNFPNYFTREYLLEGPHLVEERRIINRKKGLHAIDQSGYAIVGKSVGAFGGRLLDLFTDRVGAAGIHDQEKKTTNWYKSKSGLVQILKLAYMRKKLFENNLISTYPDDVKTGFFDPEVCPNPPESVRHYRTADGSYNHLDDPMVGAAGTRFYRNVGDDIGLEATRPRSNPAKNPVNVREISRLLFTWDEGVKEVPFLNMLAAGWIQFMVHDWVSHGANQTGNLVYSIFLSTEDPARQKYGIDEMIVEKTFQDPTRMANEGEKPPTYINEVTHWWDASQLYGSDQSTQDRVRSHIDGKLALTEYKQLPLDPETKAEMTGFNRNWWIGLSVFHTLFSLEHNAICDQLKASFPQWDDERLFQTARLINAAVLAKIHTVEWTPAILPNKTLNEGMHSNWYGLLTKLFDKKEHKSTLAKLNIPNSVLGGIIGNPKGRFAKFALSEEFTAVYRLHTLLPDRLKFKHLRHEQEEEVSLDRLRDVGASKLRNEYNLPDLLYSFGNQHPGAIVNNNYPATLQELSVPGIPFQDIGAIDLYRDRERGVPAFNQLRRELGLLPMDSFHELTEDLDVIRKLRDLYGVDEHGKDNIEDMDLLVGTLCEGHRPDGFGFGETLFQVFLLNGTWRLLGDRFYTDGYNAETYTKEGLDWIDQASLKSILLRHFPELQETGLANIKNAFEPWDNEEQAKDLSRHPLRRF